MEYDTARPRDAVFVLFGITGDLAWRRVVPSLFNLFAEQRLPEHFRIIGVGRRDYDGTALANHLRSGVEQHARQGPPDDDQWNAFAAQLHYIRGDLTDASLYAELAERRDALTQEWGGEPECIFYLATPPSLFTAVAHGIGGAGLSRPRENTRVVVEKPIGHDLQSSREINAVFRRHFDEDQVFRIDHFLGKETVQNIFVLRFANPMFEPIWDRRYVDHVAVTVAETLGVEARGSYYEEAGALRDMIQNHLMQLLCLVAMEPPVKYEAGDIQARKTDVLQAIRTIGPDDVPQCTARGQYGGGWMNGEEMPAYREEPGVDGQSGTETYAAVKLLIDNWRWQGVPFYLRTGKRMAADVSEISIRFRDVPHRPFPPSTGFSGGPARLVIQLQPEHGVVLKFLAKEPGYEMRLRPASMRFCYREAFGAQPPGAYETLLWDVMTNNNALFMRADQVELAWGLLMPIIEQWQENPAPDFPNYTAGSWGPESGELLVARDGRSWLTPTLEYIDREKGKCV